MSDLRDADVAIRAVDLQIARTSSSTGDVSRVVDGLDITLDAGGTLVVMGPTGAGKSSLSSVLAGREEPGLEVVGGQAFVAGTSIQRRGRAGRIRAYRTGYLVQGEAARLPSRLTVEEIIGSPITDRDRKVDRRALSVRVATLLDELSLPLGISAKYPYELSAGMRQRVACARALILDPHVFIADDVFANLDVSSRAAVRRAISRRAERNGMGSLLVTNDVDAVRELDADVLVLKDGNVVGFGRGIDGVRWTPSAQADRRLLAT